MLLKFHGCISPVMVKVHYFTARVLSLDLTLVLPFISSVIFL